MAREHKQTRTQEAVSQGERLWSIPEAMRFLGVSRRTLYTYVRYEGLPCVRLGRCKRFRPVSLRQWAAAREQAA